jgi:hypothetical protein
MSTSHSPSAAAASNNKTNTLTSPAGTHSHTNSISNSTLTRSSSRSSQLNIPYDDSIHGRHSSNSLNGIVHDEICYPCTSDGYDVISEIGRQYTHIYIYT